MFPGGKKTILFPKFEKTKVDGMYGSNKFLIDA